MATINITLDSDGVECATGPSYVTFTPNNNVRFVTAGTLGAAQALAFKHKGSSQERIPWRLFAGENLYCFGTGGMAVDVTATS